MKLRTVILSRTDAIGDVVLTLPLAKLIKNLQKDVKIIFFGRSYTQPVIDCCSDVDEFLNYDDFSGLKKNEQAEFLRLLNADAIVHVFPRKDIAIAARSACIPMRVGTTGRLYHWFSCNRMVRMSRRKSDLHEAQLNVKLLKPLGHSGTVLVEEISKLYSMDVKELLQTEIRNELSIDRFKLVIHPKSNASAREWNLENYASLLKILPANKFQFIITGGIKEKSELDSWQESLSDDVINLAGKLSLAELIALLNSVNGIIAASTGPLHIAASLGKHALGIYPPIRPMDPGRWAPVGEKAGYIVIDRNCSECRSNPQRCHCINEITPRQVAERISAWIT